MKLREGSVYLVPIPETGSVPVIVARLIDRSGAFVYAFNDDLLHRDGYIANSWSPETAVFAGDISTAAMKGGAWKHVGMLANWRREKWSISPLKRHDLIDPSVVHVTIYDDHKNPLAEMRHRSDSPELDGLWPDAVYGHEAAEVAIAKSIRGSTLL